MLLLHSFRYHCVCHFLQLWDADRFVHSIMRHIYYLYSLLKHGIFHIHFSSFIIITICWSSYFLFPTYYNAEHGLGMFHLSTWPAAPNFCIPKSTHSTVIRCRYQSKNPGRSAIVGLNRGHPTHCFPQRFLIFWLAAWKSEASGAQEYYCLFGLRSAAT